MELLDYGAVILSNWNPTEHSDYSDSWLFICQTLFILHCTFYILYSNAYRRSNSSIVLLWKVCFPKCPPSNWEHIIEISWALNSCCIKDCMTFELLDYLAVRLETYRSIRWCTAPRKFSYVSTTPFSYCLFKTWQC